jgi:hypothetical protein
MKAHVAADDSEFMYTFEPSERLEESTPQIPLPDTPTVGIFYTVKI